MKKWNCNFSIPFSSMHKYVREDSMMMNKFVTPLKEHYSEFDNKFGEMLPAFIQWDSEIENYKKINPIENNSNHIDPIKFGDNWNDNLEKKDKQIIDDYFQKFEHLKNNFGFCLFKVGALNIISNSQIKMWAFNSLVQEILLLLLLQIIFSMMFL